jgi:tetratricopeptide (TPR) repeat protein
VLVKLFSILLFPVVSFAQQHASLADSTIAVRYAHAVELFYEHDDTGEALAEATNEFAIIVHADPRHAPSLSYLGMIALEKNNLRSADSLLTLALASDSTCPEAHVGRAQWFRQRQYWQEGFNEARRAITLAPASALARRELVIELLHRVETPITERDVIEAIPHLQKLLEFDANDRDAHHDLAQSYEQLKRWKEAAIEYREVLRIGQTSEDMDVWVYTVHLDAARCFENFGDFRHAVEELKLYVEALKELGSDNEEVKKITEQIHQLEQKDR